MSEPDFQRCRSCLLGERSVAARQTNEKHNRFELLLMSQLPVWARPCTGEGTTAHLRAVNASHVTEASER